VVDQAAVSVATAAQEPLIRDFLVALERVLAVQLSPVAAAVLEA
jgi:hypothetical protein